MAIKYKKTLFLNFIFLTGFALTASAGTINPDAVLPLSLSAPVAETPAVVTLDAINILEVTTTTLPLQVQGLSSEILAPSPIQGGNAGNQCAPNCGFRIARVRKHEVPEPSALFLLAISGLGLCFYSSLRNRKK